MRAGSLRHRVNLQTRSATADGFGEPAQTWTTTHANLPASVEPLVGREMIAAQAVQAPVTHRVRLRYVAGVEAAQRVLFGSRVLDVHTALNRDERNRELELMCSEGLTQG